MLFGASTNIRYEPRYEPIRAFYFRDYNTGLTTTHIRELAQWLVDRPLSVTVSKLHNHLTFLKCRRNVMWDICHSKNDHVAPENSMLPVFFLCVYSYFSAGHGLHSVFVLILRDSVSLP